MNFRIISPITRQESIARGHGIRELPRLQKTYGKAVWRKMKGMAQIECADGQLRMAELHWYEGHGIGKVEIKLKRYLD